MKERFAFCFMAVLLAVTWGSSARADLAGPQKGRVGGELVFWFPTVSGDAAWSGTNILGLDISGTDIDVDDVLGLNQNALTMDVGLWVNPLKRVRLSLWWFIDQRTGNKILNKPVNIGGKPYSPGVRVDSDIEMQRWRLLLEIALLRNDLGRIALTSGVTYLDIIASISGKGFMFNESAGDRIQVPLPVVGVAGEIHIPFLKGLGVFAEANGFGVSYSQINARLIEARGGLNFKTRFVFVQGGYQLLSVNADAFDAVDVSYSLKGPFGSVGVKF